ncbi:MAG: hypothetical protein OXH70_02120 [Acidobacteria bacterium]|nr:hypothetical protein [Acidobacteriota bacterium]MCY3971575.1 hypothetical protein [Acidobacteriota bacterium]
MTHPLKNDPSPVEYGDATPEDVALALRLYRPKPKQTERKTAKASEPNRTRQKK